MYQPDQQWKRYLWRAARVLQRKPADYNNLARFDEAARDRFFEKGQAQIAGVAERLEAQTGFTLQGRTVLDYGCGAGRTALALAERCEHVYGLDVSPATLNEADLNAKRLNLSNTEWLEAGRLAELEGKYDLVVSFFVFQHIRMRVGERIFATLVRGLRPGGAGVIHVTLLFPRFQGFGRTYLYQLMNSYSLNRLGKLLADQGITDWHVRLHPRPDRKGTRKHYEDATIIFRKDATEAAGAESL